MFEIREIDVILRIFLPPRTDNKMARGHFPPNIQQCRAEHMTRR